MKPKTVTTQIRVPAELHENLKECAASSGISMNAEIIRRLSGEGGAALASVSQLEEVTKQYNELCKMNDELVAESEKLRQLTKAVEADMDKTIDLFIQYVSKHDKSAELDRDTTVTLLGILSAARSRQKD